MIQNNINTAREYKKKKNCKEEQGLYIGLEFALGLDLELGLELLVGFGVARPNWCKRKCSLSLSFLAVFSRTQGQVQTKSAKISKIVL